MELERLQTKKSDSKKERDQKNSVIQSEDMGPERQRFTVLRKGARNTSRK